MGRRGAAHSEWAGGAGLVLDSGRDAQTPRCALRPLGNSVDGQSTVPDYDRYKKEFRVLLKNREQPAVVRVPPGGTLEQDDSATIIKDEKGNTVAAFRLPEVQGWYENRDATADSLPPGEGF